MYLFRVYDFFSKLIKGGCASFLLSLVLLPVSACNNTRRPLNNNDGLLKSAFVSFQQKRLVVIL